MPRRQGKTTGAHHVGATSRANGVPKREKGADDDQRRGRTRGRTMARSLPSCQQTSGGIEQQTQRYGGAPLIAGWASSRTGRAFSIGREPLDEHPTHSNLTGSPTKNTRGEGGEGGVRQRCAHLRSNLPLHLRTTRPPPAIRSLLSRCCHSLVPLSACLLCSRCSTYLFEQAAGNQPPIVSVPFALQSARYSSLASVRHSLVCGRSLARFVPRSTIVVRRVLRGRGSLASGVPLMRRAN